MKQPTPTTSKRIRRAATFVLAFVAGVWVCDRWMSNAAVAADGGASTMPATSPATQPAATRPVLPGDVAAIAGRVREAYAKRPIRLKATLTADFDVGGLPEHASHAITATLGSPTRFRHESAGELVIAGDGSSITALDVAGNDYLKQPLTDANTTPTLDEDVQAALLQQDPALLVAITGDADPVFLPTADASVRVVTDPANAKADVVETAFPDGTVVRTAIDRSRGTITSVTWDFAKRLRDNGATDVKRATAMLTYDESTIGGDAIDDAQFAFKLPAGAHEAVASDSSHSLAGVGDAETALNGKPAPAVSLSDLDGKLVHAVGEGAPSGDVVVLDFFATWCGPCRASLPHVAEVARTYKARGVRVYVLDQQEDADTVKRFLADQHLEGFTALLDIDGKAGERYLVNGIPQTVVIGRDGKVRQVMVGFDPSSPDALGKAVENALK